MKKYEPQKINCIIVHGCPGTEESTMDLSRRMYDKHWMPWIRSQLDSMEIPAEIALMPEPWAPVYKNWKKEFEKYPVAEQTILIGHSCGCAFLTRWLGDTKRKVMALVLVAPWKIGKHDLYNFTIDPTIKNRIKTILFFTSDTEVADGKKSLEMYHSVLGGKIITLPNHGHYTMEDMRTDEFPELMEEIKNLLQ